MTDVRRAPGAALLHPAFVVSLVVLIANDHWLKHTYPGFWSGKLSDFAAVLILPLFLQALFEVAVFRLRRRPPSAVASHRALFGAILVTLVVYAPPEIWEPAEVAYRYGVGALKWPLQAFAALVQGAELPSLRPVRATADVSDLIALPMLWIAWRLGRRSGARNERLLSKRAGALLGSAGLLGLAWPSSAHAAETRAPSKPGEFTHDGFFFEFQLGPGVLFVDSTASVSNGFRQPIASTARGVSFPAGALEFGGTLPRTGFVLGGRIGRASVQAPLIGTLGEHFKLRDLELVLFEAEGIVKYYLDRRGGLHFGAGLGLASLDREGGLGEQQRGPCGSLEVGQSFWIARQFSAGGAARLFYARLSGEEQGETSVLMPGLFATITWH
jgi:hypothetical protein